MLIMIFLFICAVMCADFFPLCAVFVLAVVFVALSSNATSIQRIFRGYRGRVRFLLALKQREEAAQRSLFESMATRIQKVVRGVLSRKFVQNVYARRAYIGAVAQRGSELARESEEHLERQLLASSESAIQRRAAQFETLTSNIHHLVGTKAIPSVFKSKLGPQYDASAFDIPMEEHIKEAFQNRQTTLRKMRTKIFQTNKSTQQQQQPASQLTASSSSSSPSAISSAAVVSASPAVSAPLSVSSSRSSRPISATRLAPLHTASSSSPSMIDVSPVVRPVSSTSSLSSQQPMAQPTQTQKLPSLRNVPSTTPSGRTLNATQLYNSKIHAASPDVEEEKQQVPLALALGGHVSTTPTGSRKSLGLSATRPIAPQPSAASAASASSVATPPDSKRKWSQPTKPNIQIRADA